MDTAPIVLYDSGYTRPLAPYLKLGSAHAFASQRAVLLKSVGVLEGRQTINPRLVFRPIKTPELSPGPLSPRAMQLPFLERPVFVVGEDALSRQWLQQRRNRLIALQAVGMAVNVETAEALAQLKGLIAPLELYALPGSGLAKQLRFSHYPALISTARIEQ